jgi:hypothetical protein
LSGCLFIGDSNLVVQAIQYWHSRRHPVYGSEMSESCWYKSKQYNRPQQEDSKSSEWAIDCCLTPSDKFSAITRQERVTFWWDDNDARSTLN